MTDDQQEAADGALYDVGIIASILQHISAGVISNQIVVDGCELQWLAKQLDQAADVAKAALDGHTQGRRA